MYEKGQGTKQNYKKAYKWFKKSAKQGDARAQYHLGQMYLEGLGVEVNPSKAEVWFKKAKDNGFKG
jgi:TPR repeat protein